MPVTKARTYPQIEEVLDEKIARIPYARRRFASGKQRQTRQFERLFGRKDIARFGPGIVVLDILKFVWGSRQGVLLIKPVEKGVERRVVAVAECGFRQPLKSFPSVLLRVTIPVEQRFPVCCRDSGSLGNVRKTRVDPVELALGDLRNRLVADHRDDEGND
jgi:hypothetical protein